VNHNKFSISALCLRVTKVLKGVDLRHKDVVSRKVTWNGQLF
jgi:hypothetical protein